MGIFDKFMSGKDDEIEPEPVVDINKVERIEGKIIKVIKSEGFGFLSTKSIPFTRIFFHWSALRPDTLNFTELRVGMKCTFKAIEIPGKGWRALQIEVEPKTSFTHRGSELE